MAAFTQLVVLASILTVSSGQNVDCLKSQPGRWMRLALCRVVELWLWQLAALQCSRKAPVNPALPWRTTATPAILALAQVL